MSDERVDAGSLSQAVNDFMALLRELMLVMDEFRVAIPQELIELRDRVGIAQVENRHFSIANPMLFFHMGTALHLHGNMTMGRLSEALSVPFSTATRMADWFVNNGYAVRLPDPDDRRVVRLALTENGRRVHNVVQLYVAQAIGRMLSALTDEERDSLLLLTRKVVTSMKKAEA